MQCNEIGTLPGLQEASKLQCFYSRGWVSTPLSLLQQRKNKLFKQGDVLICQTAPYILLVWMTPFWTEEKKSLILPCHYIFVRDKEGVFLLERLLMIPLDWKCFQLQCCYKQGQANSWWAQVHYYSCRMWSKDEFPWALEK